LADNTINPFLSLAIHPEYLAILSVRETGIQALALHPFEPPLDLELFRSEKACFERLSDPFAELRKTVGEKEKEIAIALSGSMVLIKKIPMALGLGDEVVKTQMRWEAEQFLLSSLDDYVMNHQRLPFSTPSGNPLYLQVLVRKQIIQLLKDFVRHNGMVLKDIDVDFFSIVRTVLANYDVAPRGTVALIEVQNDSLVFIFIHHREYYLSHRIFFRRDEKNAGVSSEINKLLLKELRRLVFGHRLGKGIEDLDGMFLFGREIIHEMIEELKKTVAVEIINPFRCVSIQPVVSESEAFHHAPEKFTASLGLALKRVPSLQSGL
jgi:Tfp pilus assembly PilM family ATPase